MKKNVASQSVGAQMITAADGTAFTGTVTVVITEDNGTQTASGGTAPAHEGNGYHSYSPTQGETDADHIAFTWTGTGAIPVTIQVYTTFPQTVDNDVLASGATGFTAIDTVVDAIKVKTDFLPSATAGAAGGVFIAGTNAATVVTTSFTTTFIGNITGDLSGSVGSLTANNDKTGYALSAAGDQSIADLILPKSNTAYPDISFLMVDETDFTTPETGLTVTATRSIDGGTSFSATTGTVAEAASGIYHFDASAADMNGKIITFKFSATGAMDTFVVLTTSL